MSQMMSRVARAQYLEALLARAQRLLRLLAFGDVDVHADPLAHRSVRREQRHGMNVGPAPAAPGPPQPVLGIEGAALTHGLTPHLLHSGTIVGMDRIGPAVVAEPFLQALAGVAAPARRVGDHRALGISLPHRLGPTFDQAAEPFLALPQRLLAGLGVVQGIAHLVRRPRRGGRGFAAGGHPRRRSAPRACA